MYAIIRSGGKQAKVQEGDVIDVERLKGVAPDAEVRFTPLLLVNDDGSVVADADSLGKATVTAKVLGEHRGEKIEVFKYKNKSGYRRSQGHRQTYTTIEVTGISGPGAKKSKTKTKSKVATPKAEAKDAKASDEATEPKPTAGKDASAKSAKDEAARDKSGKDASAKSGKDEAARDKSGKDASAKSGKDAAAKDETAQNKSGKASGEAAAVETAPAADDENSKNKATEEG